MVLAQLGRSALGLGQAIALLLLFELPVLAQSDGAEPMTEPVPAPVSAEDQPLIEPKDAETLRDEAAVDEDETDAKTEIVVTPLSDRCLALEVEPETEAEPDAETAAETAIETAVETEAKEAKEAKEAETEAKTEIDEEAEAEAAVKRAQEQQTQREICQLYEADQLYQQGQLSEARNLYQAVKPPFAPLDSAAEAEPTVPITRAEDLPPAGQVYLREAAAGREQNLETRIVIPLKLLTQNHPEFVQGHIQYAEALRAAGEDEQALRALNHAVSLYPDQAELVQAAIEMASAQNQWIDASMQARRFVQLNPEHPEAEVFERLAQENLQLFQNDVRDRLRANTIANVLTGAVTYGVTGNVWNTLSTIQTTTLMLRGEEGVGNGISKSIRRQIPLVEDEEVVAYVNELGQALAKVAGRDEFEYEFFVIMDESLNAFALPGGKIFVNAGAIAKTRSEAELAGLLAHELAHTVLSHGFQLVSNGSLLSDLSRFVPYAGYAANLVVLDYSRDMEREADELGTRILSAAGYPADGLHNLMQTLGQEERSRPLFAWMSTHPETEERVGNIQRQIQTEGFDRYGFEGVERHDQMRERVKVLIEIARREAEEEAKNRPWWR